jgi:Acetyltransferases, including N-acetylases of ribosomal proteins
MKIKTADFVFDDYYASDRYRECAIGWTDSDDVKRFACDDTWHDECGYYMTENGYTHLESFYPIIVFDADEKTPLAVMILLCGREYAVTVNPIIVNPALTGKGYGTRIIAALIEIINRITTNHNGTIEAGIDSANAASIRAFEKSGFVLSETHPSGNFLTYRYTINQGDRK